MRELGIVGTWKFESMVVRTESGKTIYPYGEKLFGMLIYTPGGHMSVLLMNPDRKKFASDDLKAGTPEEIKQAYEKFDAYCGTYTVDENKGTITHHLEGAKFPNWVGTDQVRYFELEDDRLQIKATIEIEGENWFFTAALRRE
jgi:hypothetical protein